MHYKKVAETFGVHTGLMRHQSSKPLHFVDLPLRGGPQLSPQDGTDIAFLRVSCKHTRMMPNLNRRERCAKQC